MKTANKIKMSSHIFLLLALLFFNSCAWWEQQRKQNPTDLSSSDDGYSQAPFVASQLETPSNMFAVSTSRGEDSLIKTFTLNLKTCLRDYINQDNPIQNITFTIEYYRSKGDKEKGKLQKTKATSNIQGCIQWQEEYDYKYTAKPLWIGLDRRIKKDKGAYTGIVSIPIAVNPWLSDRDRKSGLPYFLDIRSEYSREDRLLTESENYQADGLKYLSETKKEDRPLLWVPGLDIQLHEINPNKAKTNSEKEEDLDSQAIRQLLKKYQKICTNENRKDCYQRQMEMSLFIPLKYRTLDKSGLRKDELLGGTYNVETQLIISPKGANDNYLLHEKICKKESIEFNQTNKTLTLACRLNFAYFNQNALYKLVIRIIPSSKGLPFKKFEGIYTINLNFQDQKLYPTVDTGYEKNYEEALTTSKELQIIDSLNIKSIGELKETENKPQSLKNIVEVQNNKGPIKGLSFYRLHLDGYGEYKLSHVESGGSKCSERENVVERTVVFVGKLCLKDVLSSQKLNNTPFRVFLEKPKEGTIEEIYDESNPNKKLFRTDGQSCISVPIKIKHKIYNRQKYFQVDMHVLSEELNLYGKVRLALSPWQRAFQAFQDAQNLPDDVIRFDTKGIPKPQLIINQFRSINLFPSYGLDKLLNIHLFHRFYLIFQPFIRRPDNLSLGLDFRAREVLRDGHYLVRVLILRNPQETGDTGTWARTQLVDTFSSARKNKFVEESITVNNAQYITHTDSIVKAKANFVNFYMPLQLSTKQFFYIASRNFIVIEIHSADPNYFVYKKSHSEDDECVVDTEKTIWKPYRDHELENAPYVGAFNIQHWVNWNLLQPAEGIDTDKIIAQSEVGRKYKHFNFSADFEEELSDSQKVPVSESCVNEITNQDLQNTEQELSNYEEGEIINSFDPSQQEIEKCSVDNEGRVSPGLESYKKQEEKNLSTNVLENFSLENSLKLIDLSNEDSDLFIEDIKSSFEKYQQLGKSASITGISHATMALSNLAVGNKAYYRYMFLDFEEKRRQIELLSQLPVEDRKLLAFRVGNICKEDLECSFEVFSSYLLNIHQSLHASEIPLEVVTYLINKHKLLSDESRSLYNKFIQECSKNGTCLKDMKVYFLNILDSYIDKLSFYEQNLFLENLMLFFSKEDKQSLFNEIDKQCFPWLQSITKFSDDYKDCYYKTFRLFFNKMQSIESSSIYRLAKQATNKIDNSAILQNLNRLPGIKDTSVLKSIMPKPSKDSLTYLIDTGIKDDNKYRSNTLSFTKSLCFFWFDHYLKNYLEQDQMIGAYTQYMSKFDYHQILDKEYSDKEHDQIMSFYPNILKYLSKQDNVQSSGCYENYTQCVLADHCQARSVNESKSPFCSQMNIQDQTCSKVLSQACQKDPSLSLCQDECLMGSSSSYCGKQSFCNKKLRNFCITNKDEDLCAQYENRCIADYMPCLKKNTSIFNVDGILNYTEGDTSFKPLQTCLNDPYNFFQIENKMVIHELSKKENTYLGGFLETFNVAANYSIGSYMNWTAQRGRSISASSDISLNTLPLGSILNMTLGKLGVSQSMSSNESNSSRRAIDNRTGESVYLTVGSAKFEIGVKKFQNCLIVKPRPTSFNSAPKEGELNLYKRIWSKTATRLKQIIVSRPGLMICNPVEDRSNREPKYITEDYYYISQVIDPGNSQFLNLYDLANRPFVLILRGRKEFVKLYHILKMTIEGDDGNIEENGGINLPPENMFIEYPFSVEEAVGLNLTIREFNQTGFSPGIYHYPYDSDNYLNTWFANKKHKNNIMLEGLTEYNLFDVPTHPYKSIPVQR